MTIYRLNIKEGAPPLPKARHAFLVPGYSKWGRLAKAFEASDLGPSHRALIVATTEIETPFLHVEALDPVVERAFSPWLPSRPHNHEYLVLVIRDLDEASKTFLKQIIVALEENLRISELHQLVPANVSLTLHLSQFGLIVK